MNEELTMPNLAHESDKSQGGLVQFPKKERQVMSKKEEGYTKMPNSLIDDQIMAQLSDKAFKCLMLVIRQTVGFDRPSHAIAITQFQKYCGIKKRDTVMLCIKELEDFNLIRVIRKRGLLNEYILTPNQYRSTVLVPLNGTSTSKGDGTSTIKQDYTSTVERGTIKETFKETLKENKKKNVPVDKSENDIFLDSIEYHHDNQNTYSLKELANVYTVKSDFITQAKAEDPTLSNEKILSELKNFAQWTTGKPKNTAQGWMNFWIYRIQKLNTAKAKPVTQAKTAPKTKKLSESQIDMFSKKLCNHIDFASMYSNVGETQKQFESRIAEKLREPQKIQDWASYLRDVGFIWKLEDLAL